MDAKNDYLSQIKINKEEEILQSSLKEQLSELNKLSPEYGEEKILENKRKFMMQTEKISSALKVMILVLTLVMCLTMLKKCLLYLMSAL